MAKRAKAKKNKKSEAVNEFVENARAMAEGKKERDREKLAAHVALIERRLLSVKEAFYDIGLALKQIRDDELYELDEPPVKDFDAFLAKRGWFGRSYAYQLIDIATYYDREAAIALKTTSMAHEVIQYAKRKLGSRDEAQRIATSGEIEGHRLIELTAEDVALLGRKRKKSKKDDGKAQLAAKREARAFDEWLADHGLPGAVARAAQDDDGEWIVDVSIPVAVLAKFRARAK
jgi:hypothetical protein